MTSIASLKSFFAWSPNLSSGNTASAPLRVYKPNRIVCKCCIRAFVHFHYWVHIPPPPQSRIILPILRSIAISLPINLIIFLLGVHTIPVFPLGNTTKYIPYRKRDCQNYQIRDLLFWVAPERIIRIHSQLLHFLSTKKG
jgi:hypothetical protein